MFVTPEDVRAYLGTQADSGKWTEANATDSIKAATAYLATVTARQFTRFTGIKQFSTNGMASLTIPDLVSATEVLQDGVALIEKSSYWLLPDAKQDGISTGIQLRSYSAIGDGPWYMGRSDWWDRGLDMPNPLHYGSAPNDLAIDGTWGYDEHTDTPVGGEVFLPDDAAFAIKVMAAFYLLRPDSVLGNVSVTPEGAVRTYTQLPLEVRAFIDEWRLGAQAVLV